MDLDDIFARVCIVACLVLIVYASKKALTTPDCEKISFDNHEYIRIKSSVTHSPDCKCHQKQSESQGGE